MAVQAQYPSNVLFLNTRGEQERKEMDYPQDPPRFLDQSTVFFSNGVNGNPRKRGREAPAVSMTAPAQQSHPVGLLSLQSQPYSTPLPPPTLISLAQLQSQPPPLVSTGLRLAFEDQKQHHQNQNQSNLFLSPPSSCSSSFSSILSEEIAAQINQQKDEIEQFLHAQGEQLRRALAERRQRHYRALLGVAEEVAARRLREKEAEVERAARRTAELEDRLARLRTESMAWQAKAMAEQATAASLHAQLQQAAAAAAAAPPQGKAEECGDESPAEDAESAHVDPDRVERQRACRACRRRPVSVVLLPCCHLCLCSSCDAATGDACPVCRCLRTGSVHVFFS